MLTTNIKDRTAQYLGEARDIATFLQYVDKWVSGTPDLGYNIHLFRGQRSENWLLKPGIARHACTTPTTEARMLAEFKQRAIPYLESTLDLAEVDWLAIAQHHAMPTRLLDWSGSALAALWFAIKQPSDEPAEGRSPPAAAVWMLACDEADVISDEERQDPLHIGETKILKPRHVSRRIAAQDGWFSVHRGKPDGLGMQYVSLDTNQTYKKRLGYVRIPAAVFGAIRRQLQTAGINRAVLFPDLDGVAGTVTGTYLVPDDPLPLMLGTMPNPET